MDNMFSKKAWCKPAALASSTGLSIKNTNSEESSSSSQFPYDSDAEKENDLPKKNMLNLNIKIKKIYMCNYEYISIMDKFKFSLNN